MLEVVTPGPPAGQVSRCCCAPVLRLTTMRAGSVVYLMIDISRISRRTWEKLRSVILPCTARQQWNSDCLQLVLATACALRRCKTHSLLLSTDCMDASSRCDSLSAVHDTRILQQLHCGVVQTPTTLPAQHTFTYPFSMIGFFVCLQTQFHTIECLQGQQ